MLFYWSEWSDRKSLILIWRVSTLPCRLRSGRRAPSCGETVHTDVWQHFRQLLSEQWQVHAAGGHQRAPLQVRSCVCECVSAGVIHVLSEVTHWLFGLQVWQWLLRAQVWQHGAGGSANGRGADHPHCVLCESAAHWFGWNDVLLLQMVRLFITVCVW